MVKFYDSPSAEVINVIVEKGFEASEGTGGTTGGGGWGAPAIDEDDNL